MITSPTGIIPRRAGGNGGRPASTVVEHRSGGAGDRGGGAAGDRGWARPGGSPNPAQELLPGGRAELQDGPASVRLGVPHPDHGARTVAGGGQFDTAIAIAAVTGLTPAGKLVVAHGGPSDSCSVADAETTVFYEQSETLHVQVTRVGALRVLGLNSRSGLILASGAALTSRGSRARFPAASPAGRKLAAACRVAGLPRTER